MYTDVVWIDYAQTYPRGEMSFNPSNGTTQKSKSQGSITEAMVIAGLEQMLESDLLKQPPSVQVRQIFAAMQAAKRDDG